MPTMALAWEGSRPDKTTCAPGRGELAYRHGEPRQRPHQNIGKYQIVRAAGANCLRADTGSANKGDHRCRVVLPGIVSGSAHGHRVDISGGNARPQQSCRRDCKHAGAGADIEHVACAPAFRQIIEREETAARRPMMTGAEGERSLDLDADVVCSQIGTVMRAVNDEASRAHGLQSGKAFAQPSRWRGSARC